MARPLSKKPTLREALLSKVGNPDRFHLRRIADAARKRYGPMSPADTYAVLADERHIPLHKYLAGDDLNRVRGIIAGAQARLTAAPVPRNDGRPPVKTEARLKEIVIDGARFAIDDPILPSSVVADAKRMAGVYPLTYVFENSVREVVRRVMEKKHGTAWFKQPMVPRKVLDHVATNKANEAAVPWHAARGGHDIHYTTIDDLLAIMFATNDNKPVFEAALGKETGVRHLVEIIETARHTVAHHRPLAPDDLKRLELNVRAWQKLMRERNVS